MDFTKSHWKKQREKETLSTLIVVFSLIVVALLFTTLIYY